MNTEDFAVLEKVLRNGVCVCLCVLVTQSCVFATPWTVAHQAPLSMEFSRQEFWSHLPFPSPWGLPNPGMMRILLKNTGFTLKGFPMARSETILVTK